jgi:chaperonin GroEL (HSP60 family)
VPHGPVVEIVAERGFKVHAINPNQVDRFHDRFTLAGAKDNSRDAEVMASALRIDPRCFRLLATADPTVIELREWSRITEDLSAERNRLTNRMREQLWRYFPAMLELGAPSEAEMKSKKEALDDAISATKAAVAEGIVPGGGLALLRCIAAVSKEEAACEGDELTGVRILARALTAPARQIAENSAVVARMMEGKGDYGFDAARNEYVDLVEAGIVDPTKVVRVALENAVSVASVLLLTEATMTEIPEVKQEVRSPDFGM